MNRTLGSPFTRESSLKEDIADSELDLRDKISDTKHNYLDSLILDGLILDGGYLHAVHPQMMLGQMMLGQRTAEVMLWG